MIHYWLVRAFCFGWQNNSYKVQCNSLSFSFTQSNFVDYKCFTYRWTDGQTDGQMDRRTDVFVLLKPPLKEEHLTKMKEGICNNLI